MRKERGREPETDLTAMIVPRYECVCTPPDARHHEYVPSATGNTILQMMHVSGHKTQKDIHGLYQTSSEEIADEIAAMSKKRE